MEERKTAAIELAVKMFKEHMIEGDGIGLTPKQMNYVLTVAGVPTLEQGDLDDIDVLSFMKER